MTHAEVKEMVESIGLESAYHHFAEGESPDPPFLVFLYPNADNFAADGIVYFSVNVLHIELYCESGNDSYPYARLGNQHDMDIF